MQKQILGLFLCLVSSFLTAQEPSKRLIVLPITDYIVQLNDSISLVQIKLPENSKISIKEKTMAVLLHKYNNDSGLDTSIIGYGRCNLIKGLYYYFTIKPQKNQTIKAGDLLHCSSEVTIKNNGMLADLSLLNIQFKDVYEKPFYALEDPYSFASDNEEGDYYGKMVEDIKFTANNMITQMPENNTIIKEGRYKGNRLFDKMKTITGTDLVYFFSYILARPNKYKGHEWKISEIFATWMFSGSPMANK